MRTNEITSSFLFRSNDMKIRRWRVRGKVRKWEREKESERVSQKMANIITSNNSIMLKITLDALFCHIYPVYFRVMESRRFLLLLLEFSLKYALIRNHIVN